MQEGRRKGKRVERETHGSRRRDEAGMQRDDDSIYG